MSDNRMNFPYEGNEEQQHKNTNGFGVPSDGGWGVSSSRKEEKNQAEPAGQSSGEGSQGAQPATPLAGQASQPAAGPSYGQQEQNSYYNTQGIYGGSAKRLVAALVSDGSLSEADIAELSAMFRVEVDGDG